MRHSVYWLLSALCLFGLVSSCITGCGDADRGDGSPGGTGNDQMQTEGIEITKPSDGDLLAKPRTEVAVDVERPERVSELELRVDQQTRTRKQLEPEGDDFDVITFSGVDLTAHDATEQGVRLRIVGFGDDDRIVAGSRPVEILVDSRKRALEDLREASDRKPVVHWSRVGLPEAARFDVSVKGDGPVEKGFDFVETWSELLRLDAPRDILAVADIRSAENGATEVQFKQHFGDFPVAGAALTLTLDGDRASLFTGSYVEELPEKTDTQIKKDVAEETAIESVDGHGRAAVGYTRRVVYDPAVFESGVESDSTIAWRVAVQGVYQPERTADGEVKGLPGS